MSMTQIKDTDELYDDLADIKLRIAVTRVVMENAEKLQKEIDNDPELQRIADEISRRSKDQTFRLIDRQLRIKRLTRMVRHTLPRVGQVAAAILLVFYVGLSTAIAVSSTVRVKVLELVIRMEEKYTELSLEENTDASFDVPSAWLANYYPTYIPEGYELTEVLSTMNNSEYMFRDEEGKRIVFSENDEYGMTNIDTEGAEVGQEIINGKQVMTVEKDGITTLIWSDFDRYYTIWIDGSIDLALEIFDGMRRIN